MKEPQTDANTALIDSQQYSSAIQVQAHSGVMIPMEPTAEAHSSSSTPWLDKFDAPNVKKAVGAVWLAFLVIMAILAATGVIGHKPDTSGVPDLQICGISPDSVSSFFNIILVLLGVFQLSFGPILCFFGYKYFKISLFLLGGVPFGVATYMSTCVVAVGGGPMQPLLYGILAFCIGGALMVCCWFVTVFLMGFGTGVSLCVFCYVYIFLKAFASNVSDTNVTGAANNILHFASDPNATILGVVCLAVGILFGILAIKFQRVVIICVTALFGSFICWLALLVNFFEVDGFPSLGVLLGSARIEEGGGGLTFVYLALVFLLAAAGAYVQFMKTSVGHDHKNSTWRGEPATHQAVMVQVPVAMTTVTPQVAPPVYAPPVAVVVPPMAKTIS